MNKKIIFLCALIFISLAVFISAAYAKDIGANRIIPKLNFLSVDNSAGQARLSLGIQIDKPAELIANSDIQKAGQKSLEYFFIGLALPDEKFWVNLNPKEPYRVMDSVLADTDLGRIMLYADLRLKKDTCELMDPNKTEVGVEYWNRLYMKAKQLGVSDNIPAVNRIWIVADKAEAYKIENQISIIKSRLKVCSEENKKGEPLQDYALSLMQELILPRLNEKVNESPAYADLREVYQALILARWYKQKISFQENPLLTNISYNIIKDAQVDFLYRPEQIYRDYTNSFKKGEYTFRGDNDNFYSAMAIMQYFIGGINLKKTPEIISAGATQREQGRADFMINFNIPFGWQEKPNPLQIVKSTMEITPYVGVIAYSGVAVVKAAEGNSAEGKNKKLEINAPLIFEGLPAVKNTPIEEEVAKTQKEGETHNRVVLNKL